MYARPPLSARRPSTCGSQPSDGTENLLGNGRGLVIADVHGHVVHLGPIKECVEYSREDEEPHSGSAEVRRDGRQVLQLERGVEGVVGWSRPGVAQPVQVDGRVRDLEPLQQLADRFGGGRFPGADGPVEEQGACVGGTRVVTRST